METKSLEEVNSIIDAETKLHNPEKSAKEQEEKRKETKDLGRNMEVERINAERENSLRRDEEELMNDMDDQSHYPNAFPEDR